MARMAAETGQTRRRYVTEALGREEWGGSLYTTATAMTTEASDMTDTSMSKKDARIWYIVHEEKNQDA